MRLVADVFGLDRPHLVPVKTAELKQKAGRPLGRRAQRGEGAGRADRAAEAGLRATREALEAAGKA